MSSISPFSSANILPPTIPHTGPSLSSESEDEVEKDNQSAMPVASINPSHDQVITQPGKYLVTSIC